PDGRQNGYPEKDGGEKGDEAGSQVDAAEAITGGTRYRVDRKVLPRSGGEGRRQAGELAAVAKARAEKDLRQPARHAPRDPVVRPQERKNLARGIPAAPASVRAGGKAEFAAQLGSAEP